MEPWLPSNRPWLSLSAIHQGAKMQAVSTVHPQGFRAAVSAAARRPGACRRPVLLASRRHAATVARAGGEVRAGRPRPQGAELGRRRRCSSRRATRSKRPCLPQDKALGSIDQGPKKASASFQDMRNAQVLMLFG